MIKKLKKKLVKLVDWLRYKLTGEKPWKLVVLVLLVRNHPEEGIQVLLQLRTVIDKSYDWLYHLTLECIGETLKSGESLLDAISRGIIEEAGVKDPKKLKFRILWTKDSRISTTGKGDKTLIVAPYRFVQQLSDPQPWAGPCFVAQVGMDFNPELDEEGEVGGHYWKPPQETIEQIKSEPGSTMGLHAPFVGDACQDLIDGNFNIQ